MVTIEHPVAHAVGADISVIHWPLDEPLRQQLARLQLPRILVVDRDGDPPEPIDELEDWIRSPVDQVELRSRGAALRRRLTADPCPRPTIDDDGLLRVGREWVALSDTQLPVASLLVENVGKVVRFDAVVAACAAAGASAHPTSVHSLIGRLRTRLLPLGLDVVTVRRRGVMLQECATADGATRRRPPSR